MQDITEILNQIIFKYDLDRYYPHYRNMCGANKILRHLVREIADTEKRAIFVCDDQTGNDVVQYIAKDYEGIKFHLYTRNDLKTLEPVAWKEFDHVYLTSFHDAEYALRWFWQRDISCEWIYDIFEREGVCLEREFYAFHRKAELGLWVNMADLSQAKWHEAALLELFFQKMRLSHSNHEQALIKTQMSSDGGQMYGGGDN